MYGNKVLNRVAIFLMVLGIYSCTSYTSSLSVNKLSTEYLSDPVGLDVASPRFSWILHSSKRGAEQTAYQLIVSENKKDVEDGAGTAWNSGKVPSHQTLNVKYDGDKLQSGKTYYWRVKAWDKNGAASRWSPVHSFHMGMLDQSDWQAKWITNPDTTVSAPLFRKEFGADKEIRSAYVYVTGIGYYELYINGQKAGRHVLDPAMTDYRKRVLYASYDVKDLLDRGENAIGLMLGNGGWRIPKDKGRYAWFTSFHSFGTPQGLVQLDITYRDGSHKVVVSDDTWKTSPGPITYNNLYSGEDYDARREQAGWRETGFDDSAWTRAAIAGGPVGKLDSQLMPPIRVTRTVKSVRRTHPDRQTYLFDLGQNIPGWWKISVKGKRGARLRIRGAETLNDSLAPEPLKKDDHLSTKQNYHHDVWTTYTLRGKGKEYYEPRFFYTGFRYVEVRVDHPDQIKSVNVVGRMVHSDLKRVGHFSSSDTLLNRIYRATVRSQQSNQYGYPTDCPHREKGGYLGDGQVIAEASLHDFDMHAFYEKWLNDMSDAQQSNGRIPNTSPTIVGGMGGGIAWGSASVLIPWWMYQYYEDTQILRAHYPMMKKYLGYLHQLARKDSVPAEPHIINEFGGYWDSLGEWCAPGERTDPNNPLVSTAYWYIDNNIFANICGVLGKQEEQKQHLALADSIRQAFNQKFFRAKKNLYGMDKPYQTYLLLALDSGLVPDKYRQKVFQNLVRDIMDTQQGHLATGILGTKHLFRVMAGAGREEVLQSVVSQTTYPSWGYWIKQGATTLWERWDGEGSHNHQMFGSVNEYFYKYLAGIRAPTDEGTSTGYGIILIKPYIPKQMHHAEASLETVRGLVESKWTHQKGRISLSVTLPPNTSGKVSIPTLGQKNVVISESGKEIWDGHQFTGGVTGISDGKSEDEFITLNVASGSYSFTLSKAAD